ncbi:hypothetical protein ACN083_04015 [Rothia sp. CCM 9418]|uniref:hypothetical protein n=1 Tax=Rothia sp. CCM 9418 TaxID=3402661 RepID=UPI003AE359EF
MLEHHAPAAVKTVSALVFFQALCISIYAILLTVFATNLTIGLPLTLCFIAIAGCLGWSAYALLQARRYARSMILVWQLFIIIIAVQAVIASGHILALLTVLTAGINIILLFSSTVSKYLQ